MEYVMNSKKSKLVGIRLAGLLVLVVLAFPALATTNPAGALQLISRVDHLDTLAREPMVVQHPGGALFVSGYGSQIDGTDWTAPPPLWRSDDGGETWLRVAVGLSADGAQGNSDVDLTVGPDGTLYLLAMGFNRATREGTHVAVGVSHDIGQTWQWHWLSQTRFDDRPWISISAGGVAHVIWNDGAGVCYSVSRDAGRRWTEQTRIHSVGGSSHLAVGPDGTVAVRISPISASANRFDEATDLIAVSRDAGATWLLHDTPGDIVWDPTLSDPDKIPRWVEPVAWGADGTLYHLWSEGEAIVLAASRDYGAHWTRQIVAEEKGQAFFPYMVANANGDLAATWFVQTGQTLTARLVLIETPLVEDAPLQIHRAAPFSILAWDESGSTPVPTSAGEYIPVVFLNDGELAVVSPIQDSFGDRWGFTWWRFAVQKDAQK